MDSRWTTSLGVALMGHGLPGSAVGWARAAETAGLGSAWIVEDYFQPGAFTLAGAAAAATERITIGLGVVNPYTRHPVLLAMEVAALAGLAPGRVVLGLGSSNRRWIDEQLHIPFAAPLGGLREGTDIVRRLLAGERVTHHGARFEVDDVVLDRPPAARVPIVLGVKGPRALALAGEIADGVLCSILASPAHVRRVRLAAKDPGRRFAVLAFVPTAIGADGASARARVRPLLARYLGALHGQSILEDAGLPARATEPFREALLRGARPAAELVTESMIDTLAIAGTPAQARGTLERLAEAGLDAPVAVLAGGVPVDAQLGEIGRTLVPAWAELAGATARRS